MPLQPPSTPALEQISHLVEEIKKARRERKSRSLIEAMEMELKRLWKVRRKEIVELQTRKQGGAQSPKRSHQPRLPGPKGGWVAW